MSVRRLAAKSQLSWLTGPASRRRLYSTAPRFPESHEGKSATAAEGQPDEMSEEEKREAARKLALQSFKDIGTMFSNEGGDKEVEPIDTAPIYENPEKFPHLSLLHQGQVLKELQTKFDKSWLKLTHKDKVLAYYISYGNWGPREKFDNWKESSTPLDIPFKVPSVVSNVNPASATKIQRMEEVNLAETPVRKAQFDARKMDPVTKFFIYLTCVIALAALYRDKMVGEAGKPREIIVRDPYEEERQRRKKEEEEQKRLEEERKRRKWYFLWLR